jgi:hypothetical protein
MLWRTDRRVLLVAVVANVLLRVWKRKQGNTSGIPAESFAPADAKAGERR